MLFYEKKARGGAASVNYGETPVNNVDAVRRPNVDVIRPDFSRMILPAKDWIKFTDAITRHGANPCVQLAHAGLFAEPFFNGQTTGKVIGPVDMDKESGTHVSAMDEEDMARIANDFAEAAEVIYERADAEKPFMGLTSFSGSNPAKKDVTIAKNYLTEDELKILNNLVSGYFDFAEIQAMRHNVMHMNDYAEQLDRLLEAQGDPVLDGAGKISHKQAVDKAIDEYRKYQVKTLSPVERDYLRVIEEIDRSVSEEIRDKNKKGN